MYLDTFVSWFFKCLIDHNRLEKQNFNFMWDSWWEILAPDASFAVLGYDLTTSPASGLTIICVALHMQFILFLIITIVVIWLFMWYDPAAIHDSHVVSFYAIWQSPEELIELAHKYYEESAVPKLVSMDGSFHLMLPLYWLICHATTSFSLFSGRWFWLTWAFAGWWEDINWFYAFKGPADAFSWACGII